MNNIILPVITIPTSFGIGIISTEIKIQDFTINFNQ